MSSNIPGNVAKYSGECLQTFRGMSSIRGHKGQNSTGTRCPGFLVLESRCRGFLSPEKTPWNHNVVAYLSSFLDVVVFWSRNLDVVVFWSWNLDVVAFWSWNLDVMAFWSWNLDFVVFWSWSLDVVLYVPLRPRFRYHRENKKITRNYVIMLLKNISVVQT